VYNSVERVLGSSPVPARDPPHNRFETRRLSLPLAPRTDAELFAGDHQLAELKVLAAERLAEIRKLREAAGGRGREIEVLSAERARLAGRVEDLTGEVDRLSSELERVKTAPLQAGWPPSRHSSPLLQNVSPSSWSPLPRRCSPAHGTVITELKQLLETNQVSLFLIQIVI